MSDFFKQQQARRQQSQADIQRQQAVAFARMASQAEPTDRFQQPIQAGDMVVYKPPIDLVFEVVEVKRTSAVDPNAPPGVVTLVLRAEFPVHLNAMQPTGNMIRIRHNGSAQAQRAAAAAVNEPAAEPAVGDNPAPVVEETPEMQPEPVASGLVDPSGHPLT